MKDGLVVKVISVPHSLRSRKSRQRAGYPLIASKETNDFDVWHQMFLESHFKGLTKHDFAVPPPSVLDLGCGTGCWAIDASQRWKDSKIIGFDIRNIQPRFYTGVKWVQGDFLEQLPFPSESFDFVRMACVGLAIPEDEWPSVLEEIRRVMRRGAILEIIEEDLLFPCASALLRIPTPTPVIHRRNPLANKRHSAPYRFSPVRASVEEHSSPASENSSTFSGADSLLPSPYDSQSTPQTSVSDLSQRAFTFPEDTTDSEHPQDHTRLKISWDAMLTTRFLPPKLVNVIPFYLSNTFSSTRQRDALEVELPPNSGSQPATVKARSKGHERKPAIGAFHFDHHKPAPGRTQSLMCDGPSPMHSLHSSEADSSCPLGRLPPHLSTKSRMHLAKTVSTIRNCKEAIWEEYKLLYSGDALDILSRTAPLDKEHASQPQHHVARTAFEVDWRNWELDMEDRIAMRDNIGLQVSWTIPMTDFDRPPWYVWRQKLERDPDTCTSPSGHFVAPWNPKDLCKSMRVFTAVKP